MLKKSNLNYYLILFSIPFIFLLLFGRFGLEDSDSGFLVGMGWRILNGETPYKDFYYVRPIASPLISAFWLYVLPESGQVLMMRLVNYFQLIAQVFLTTLIFEKYYDFKKLKLNKFIFSFASILITSIGTMYFQWHTTDGILFAVLGFFIISRTNSNGYLLFALAGFSFGVSALTKQNFLTVPLLGILFTTLQYNIKKSIFVFIGTSIAFLLFFLYLNNYNTLDLYLIQSTGSTTLKDLFIAGFAAYFLGHNYLILFLFSSLLLFNLLSYINKEETKSNIIISLMLSLVTINIAAFLLLENSPKLILFDRLIPVSLTYAFLYLVITRKENVKNHYIAIALIGVSWSSSISWGGMSPIMYFTPIVFLTYYLLQAHINIFNRKTNIVILILLSAYSFIANSKPYRDSYIWDISSDASQISNKLLFIKSSETISRKHLELKEIFNQYENSTILPSMPGAYYLHNKKNLLSIDWAMDVEVAFNTKNLTNDLNNCCTNYIVEKKSFGQPIGTEGKFYSSITDYVLNNYILYDSSYEFFDIYRNTAND